MIHINRLMALTLFVQACSIFTMDKDKPEYITEHGQTYRIIDSNKSTDRFKVVSPEQKSKFCVELKVHNLSNKPTSLVAALYADLQRDTQQVYSQKKNLCFAVLTETSPADIFAGKRHSVWLRPHYDSNKELIMPLTTDVINTVYNDGPDAEQKPIESEKWIAAIPGRDSNIIATIDDQGLVTIQYERWAPDTPKQELAKFLEPYAPPQEEMGKILAMINHD